MAPTASVSARDRTRVILDALTRDGFVDVDTLAAEFQVSTATVRRDLDAMAAQQLLVRTRGGAVVNSTAYELPLRYSSQVRADEKGRIARVAAERVTPGSVVALNAGTTTTAVAREIALREDLHGKPGTTALTVVTNAINIAHELTVRSHLKLVVLGGVVRPQSYELIGPLAELLLDQVTIDQFIFSANALDLIEGVTCRNESEAAIGAGMLARARQATLVMDSSKLGTRAFARLCDIPQISTLITDEGAPAEIVSQLREAGVEVVLA